MEYGEGKRERKVVRGASYLYWPWIRIWVRIWVEHATLRGVGQSYTLQYCYS